MKIKAKQYVSSVFLLFTVVIFLFSACNKFSLNNSYKIGQQIDSLNGVAVYYNGGVGNVSGRNLTKDNYNLGLKYQCVEFVKRYYYEHLNHKMPDSYGDAKDFFDKNTEDGKKNTKRGLIQFTNPSQYKPQIDDILIFTETSFNKYGHVAIISNVTDHEIEIIQQNPGKFGKSRNHFSLTFKDGKWEINDSKVLGRLRKQK